MNGFSDRSNEIKKMDVL